MKRTEQKAPLPLWVRLVFFFLLLSAVILLLFQAIFNYSLERHLQSYARDREDTLNRQIVISMLGYYEVTGSWSEVQMPLIQTAMSTNTRLLLYDPEGRLIGDTGQMRRQHMMMSAARQLELATAEIYSYALDHEGDMIGELLIAHPVTAETSAWLQQDLVFQRALSRSLLWTGLIAISAALFLGIVFSRRLSRPLEEVSRAAVRITEGDYTAELPSYQSRELNNLALCFNQLSAHLQELEMLRKRSVADISHELRTPLATLRSYVEAVKDGVLPADEKTMEILLEEIMHLSRVAGDLDELTRAETASDDQGNRENLSLNQFLQDKVASFQPLFQAKKLNLNLYLPEQEVTVFQDPAGLGKIIGNLLENAYNYTEAGGNVEVILDENPELNEEAVPPLGQEPLNSEEAKQRLKGMSLIKISDTGVGIKKENLPHIFERFFRGDLSRERGPGRAGSGIGLALVKELTRAAGGLIMVSSRPGGGTTFYLYIS